MNRTQTKQLREEIVKEFLKSNGDITMVELGLKFNLTAACVEKHIGKHFKQQSPFK